MKRFTIPFLALVLAFGSVQVWGQAKAQLPRGIFAELKVGQSVVIKEIKGDTSRYEIHWPNDGSEIKVYGFRITEIGSDYIAADQTTFDVNYHPYEIRIPISSIASVRKIKIPKK